MNRDLGCWAGWATQPAHDKSIKINFPSQLLSKGSLIIELKPSGLSSCPFSRVLHLLGAEKFVKCVKNNFYHVWRCALHWVVPRKRRDHCQCLDQILPRHSSEQKEPRVLSAMSVRGRGGLVFLRLDSSLFTVGFIAAITCSINTGTGYGGGTLES